MLLSRFMMRIRRWWTCAVWLVLCVTAKADESPFGLPTPQADSEPGAVMLHGGGSGGLSDEFRQEFVRLAGGRDARIVVMPSDECQRGKDANGRASANGETVAEYERRLSKPSQYGRWVALKANHRVADFGFLYRDPTGDRDDAKFYERLSRATGVWLPAYDQEWLPKLFANEYPKETSRFQQALRDVVARGGVVGGLGGGMASLPETVIAGDDKNGDGGWTRAKLRFGLALLSGVVVDQNFDARAGRLERLSDLLRSGPRLARLSGKPGVERRTIGLGVERHTVLILQGSNIRALGEGRGHIFLKSNGDRTITWRTLAAGDEPIVLQSGGSKPRSQAPKPATQSDDDLNPLGMPEPKDKVKPGTVVLHGGGSTGEMIDLLPTLTRTAKPALVHCPAARETCRPTALFNGKSLEARLDVVFAPWRRLQTEGRVSSLAYITTNDPRDANRETFVAPLGRADALWFCGGDQRPLSKLFVDPQRPTRFQQQAWEIVGRGGVVGGSSAGLAIMPDVMIEGGESENGKPAAATLSRGLGMLKHVLAEQHFDARAGRIERLTSLLRDHQRLAKFAATCEPKRMIGLAVEEDTALILSQNRLRVTGKKHAHVFLQSTDSRQVTWHALKAGDAAVLHKSDGGYVLELDDWEFAE